ncbi:MAG: hypothetical protein RR364_01025 [Lachnospiraceae bacterium]
MNISGIRPYEGINNYFRISEEEQIAGLNQGSRSVSDTAENQLLQIYEIEAARGRQTQTALDYAKTYDPKATYSMKGRESDLAGLDIERSISASHKEEMVRQYEFLVNPAKASKEEQAQLVKRAQENFDFF